MSRNLSEGFDPLKIQAENRIKKERSETGRKKLRKILAALLLPFLIVIGMYAVGGTGSFSEWKAVRNSLAEISDGDVSAENLNKLIKSAQEIKNVRGNHAPLAGMYTIYTLQMISDGNNRNAARSLKILQNDYSSEIFFAKLWDRGSLTDVCKTCGSKPGFVKCRSCNGTGRLLRAGGRLKKNGHSNSSSKVCMVCKGSGKVKANITTCTVCGGSGRVISKERVAENLQKAIKREKILVTLKCVQCALSLRWK
jgi:hypothetical protein